jgi:N-acetylmuramoyl-L-alanine amidase
MAHAGMKGGAMQPTTDLGFRMVNVAAALPHDYNRAGVAWRPLKLIRNIVIHYPADAGGTGDELARLTMLANYHLNKDWGGGYLGFGIMYHRVVEPSGTIYETQPLELITWHAHEPANTTGLAIMVDVPLGGQPTAAQRAALLAYLEHLTLHTPAIPAGVHDVWGHREMPHNSTSCPGPVMALVEEWRKQHE